MARMLPVAPRPVLNEADMLHRRANPTIVKAMDGSQNRQTTSYVEWNDDFLAPAVRFWSESVPDDGRTVEQLHLPHGGVEVRWRRGHPPTLTGPSTDFVVESLHPGDDVIGFRFPPGMWPDTAECSIRDLAGITVPLRAVLAGCRETANDEVGAARRSFLRCALRTVLDARRGGALPIEIVQSFHQHDQSLSAIAQVTGWSQRQTRRRTVLATAMTVRDLRQLGRFQRFVRVVQSDVATRRRQPSADLAIAAGYADQSHLQRACRAFAGMTLSEYLDRTHHRCTHHHHRVRGDDHSTSRYDERNSLPVRSALTVDPHPQRNEVLR